MFLKGPNSMQWNKRQYNTQNTNSTYLPNKIWSTASCLFICGSIGSILYKEQISNIFWLDPIQFPAYRGKLGKHLKQRTNIFYPSGSSWVLDYPGPSNLVPCLSVLNCLHRCFYLAILIFIAGSITCEFL